MFRLDVHHHIDESAQSSMDRKLDQIITLLRAGARREEATMTVVQDIKTRLDAVRASVEAETQVDQAIIGVVRGLATEVGSLKQQLADAIATNDPAALQAILDGLGTVQTEADSNAAAIAAEVTANTPAAPTT